MLKSFLVFIFLLPGIVYADDAPPIVYIKNGNSGQNSVNSITTSSNGVSTGNAIPPAASVKGTPSKKTTSARQVSQPAAQPSAPSSSVESSSVNSVSSNATPKSSAGQTNTGVTVVPHAPEGDDITQYETSSTPLPSVVNIHEVDRSKFNNKVRNCIGSNKLLEAKYANIEIRKVITKKFHNSSSCDDILKALQEAATMQEKMYNIKNDPICNLEHVDASTLTQGEVNLRKDKIEKDYNSIATLYTKYFTYNDDIASVESCMNYYNSFTTTQEINSEYASLTQEVEDRRHIVKAYGLRGFYGEGRGMSGIGLTPFIEDVKIGKVSVSQISSSYAIFEPNPQEWTLAGATDDYLVYSLGENLVGIPFQPGVSYACDMLPYQLFTVEKKIEFPKKGYSIFMLKPLE